MSSTAATEFIQKVGEDKQLYDKMHQTLGDFGQVELVDSVGQTVVKIGQENGFNFSVDEIKNAFSQFREQELTAIEGELDETQLDAVTGGTGCTSKYTSPAPTPSTPIKLIGHANLVNCSGTTIKLR